MACCSPAAASAPQARQILLPNVLAENAGKRLEFECPDRPVNSGFHITEVKLATISSLDCGRAQQEWQEIIVQVMDIPNSSDAPLTVGKLANILAESLPATLSPQASFTVELSNGDEAIRLYEVSATYTRGDDFVVKLSQRRATCKAAQRIPRTTGATLPVADEA